MNVCLTVGGSDSSAGAGIQADLATFQSLGVPACCAVTALTAQNPHGISSIMPTDLRHFRAELKAIFDYYDVDVVKTGMLVDAAHIDVLLDVLDHDHQGKTVIVDPVLVASSGRPLLDHDAVNRLHVLCRQATLVTPNWPELHFLSIDENEEIHIVADKMTKLWQTNLLLKGGHMPSEKLEDKLFLENGEQYSYWHEKMILDKEQAHGTGCRLASAIATMMMKGLSLQIATENAIDWLNKSLHMRLAKGSQYGG
ncbi:MAG: hydroxymethylpyrimidine/phosphomethylpyrimidine kinase [Mariprofundaceae bacterium]|nr:hydroxymethylpyrimidine/phosphomethylpyrimidine kinase [Mariprofundaceae bacterium]